MQAGKHNDKSPKKTKTIPQTSFTRCLHFAPVGVRHVEHFLPAILCVGMLFLRAGSPKVLGPKSALLKVSADGTFREGAPGVVCWRSG